MFCDIGHLQENLPPFSDYFFETSRDAVFGRCEWLLLDFNHYTLKIKDCSTFALLTKNPKNMKAFLNRLIEEN